MVKLRYRRVDLLKETMKVIELGPHLGHLASRSAHSSWSMA